MYYTTYFKFNVIPRLNITYVTRSIKLKFLTSYKMEEFIAFEITDKYLYIQTEEKNPKILHYNFDEDQIKLVEIINNLRVFHCGENNYYSRKLYNLLFKHTKVKGCSDDREMFNMDIINITGSCRCKNKTVAYYKGSYKNIYINHYLKSPMQPDRISRQSCKSITHMGFIESIKEYCTKYDRLSKYLHDLLKDYVNQSNPVHVPLPISGTESETDEMLDYLVNTVISAVNTEIEITKILKTVINRYREILLGLRVYIEKEFTKLVIELQSNGCNITDITFNFKYLDEFTSKVFQMTNIPRWPSSIV